LNGHSIAEVSRIGSGKVNGMADSRSKMRVARVGELPFVSR